MERQSTRSIARVGIARSLSSLRGKAEIRNLKAQIEGIEVVQLIPVTACWSMARHRPFSRGSVSMKISVRDIRDLLVEAGRKQPGIALV